ncbi:Pectinesterase inhibitor, partial [Cucurbita argyrosperma subsp. sororia]
MFIPFTLPKSNMAFTRCFLSSQTWLALIVVFLVVQTAMADTETENRINNLCHEMEEFGFCSQTFHENLNGPTDDIGLTQIAIVEAQANASNTLRYIQELLPTIIDLKLKNNLIICENAYKTVDEALQEGIGLFFKRDYRGMLIAVKIAPRAQASCDMIFSTPLEKRGLLEERNREVRILVAMAIVCGSIIVS